jgi:hypothetical protein
MRRAVTQGVLLLGALVAVSTGPAAGRSGLHGNNFFSNCSFSHAAPDDPIVHPGHPGASHPHTFFGNATTDADSTLASLRAGATTCKLAADRAAYCSAATGRCIRFRPGCGLSRATRTPSRRRARA